MIDGGICKYGLSNLIFFSGTQNNFSYKQFLLFMKEDMEKIQKEYNLEEPLIFQQDNAACHTSYDSKSIIEILFKSSLLILFPSYFLIYFNLYLNWEHNFSQIDKGNFT